MERALMMMQQDDPYLVDFDGVSLESLRLRKSEKWSVYPADVLPVWVAEMDFPVSPHVRGALAAAIENGDTGYAWEDELPREFARYASDEFHLNIGPDCVFQIPDVMAGVSQALVAFTKPGDGVAINPPVYFPFFEVLNTLGRRTVEVPLRREGEQWTLDFAALEAAFAGGARAYLLCHPHNPVGRVWSEEDLRRICTLAENYGVAIVSDEIHAPLTMPGTHFTPMLAVAPENVPCISVTSASKAWNLAGLKCGLAVAGTAAAGAFRRHLSSIPTEIQSRVGHFGAIASVAAFRNDREWVHALRGYLNKNRLLLAGLLQRYIPEARYVPPEATYLAWIDCKDLNLPVSPCEYFLERGRVALEPGLKFGAGGDSYVRLNFGTSTAIMKEAVLRMAKALGRKTP